MKLYIGLILCIITIFVSGYPQFGPGRYNDSPRGGYERNHRYQRRHEDRFDNRHRPQFNQNPISAGGNRGQGFRGNQEE